MKRTLVVVLCFVLMQTIMATDALALQPGSQLSNESSKVAAAAMRLGAGDQSIVAVRLKDKTVLKGRLSAVDQYGFVVTDVDSGDQQRVYYRAVARFAGMNLVEGTKVHVGGGFKSKLVSVAAFIVPVPRVQKNNLTDGEKKLLIGVGIGILLAIILAKVL